MLFDTFFTWFTVTERTYCYAKDALSSNLLDSEKICLSIEAYTEAHRLLICIVFFMQYMYISLVNSVSKNSFILLLVIITLAAGLKNCFTWFRCFSPDHPQAT